MTTQVSETTPGPTRQKVCSRCGTVFGCAPEPGCWCENLVLDAETLTKLRAEYADCLCPSCLAAFENGKN